MHFWEISRCKVNLNIKIIVLNYENTIGYSKNVISEIQLMNMNNYINFIG